MAKIQVEADSTETIIGFPTPKAGRVPCKVGIPKIENSAAGKPMILFPLLPLENIPCVVRDENGNEKEVQAGKDRAVLTYFASLSPGALRNGSVAKIEIAMGMKGQIHSGKEVNDEILPACAGKTILADVKNRTDDTGRLQANVNDVFRM